MSKNPRITAKERGLIKGALRRVFSRSDLRKQALDASRVTHTDPSRPRVTKWSKCPNCEKFIPTYLMEVDHLLPVIPIDSSVQEIALDVLIDNIWCISDNLVAICKDCHKLKSKAENKLRRQLKKEKLK